MAMQGVLLKDDVKNFYKIDFNKVYYKIDDCFIDVAEGEIRVGVRGYADKYARDNDGMGIFKETVLVQLSDISPESMTVEAIKKACYKYLITTEQYKNTTEV